MNLNWVDLVIILILLFSCLGGIKQGLIASIFLVLGIMGGLMAASRFYAPAGDFLGRIIALPQSAADLISFTVIFLAACFLIMTIGSLFSMLTRFRLLAIANRIGGAISGLIIGAVISGIILIVLIAFPLFDDLQDQLESSYLAPAMTSGLHYLQEKVENVLPLQLPRLAFYPEQPGGHMGKSPTFAPQFSFVEFEKIDGSTCISCQGKAVFLGYLTNRYGSLSPKFECADCARTSDGCLTYEGHHLMYRRCPAELGKQGYRFDCGIWTNGSYYRPVGICPVCEEGE